MSILGLKHKSTGKAVLCTLIFFYLYKHRQKGITRITMRHSGETIGFIVIIMILTANWVLPGVVVLQRDTPRCLGGCHEVCAAL
jgi:hypothetical protein